MEKQIEDGFFQLYSTYPKDNVCKNHKENNLCESMLISAQDAIKLATIRWQNLAISLNRKCGTKTLKTNINKWGSETKVESSEDFSNKFLSEMRQKRFVILAALGILLFTALLSALSYGIAEAVSQNKVNNLEEQIITIANISISYMNSSNNFYKNIDKRLALLERFVQIQEFAFQSGQEAENIKNYLAPRISLENSLSHSHITQLNHDFQGPLIKQVLEDSKNKNIGQEEIMKKLFEMKKSVSYVGWLQGLQEDYKCQNASIITLMIAVTYEDDQKLYTKLEDASGALISNEEEDFLYYKNDFSMQITEKRMTQKQKGFNIIASANRRMITSIKTRLVFTEASHPMTDRITVFFSNNTEEREATVECSFASEVHLFFSGSTIELPLYCGIISNWWNVTGIILTSDGEKKLSVEEFSLKWKPISTSVNSSSDILQNMEEAVSQFIQVRDDAQENGKTVSTEGLFDTMKNLAKGAEHAISMSTQFLEHISNNQIATGAAGMSSLTAILLIFQRFYKCYSSSENKRTNSAGKNKGTFINCSNINIMC